MEEQKTILVRRDTRRYIAITLILLFLLLFLLYLFYLFTRPPQFVGGERRETGISPIFSIYGFGTERISRPDAVALDEDGNMYITDTDNHRIVIFDKNGRFLAKFGKAGKAQGELWFPNGIAVAPGGNIYVLNKALDKITIYNKNYQPIWEVSIPNPQAAAVVGKRLYVATDRGVMIGDLAGKLLATFGKKGRAKGSVDLPTAVVVDKKGNIYLADSLNYRIQAFNPKGESLWTLGEPPPPDNPIRAQRKFALPSGLTMDEKGYLYALDAFSGEIYILNSKGKEIGKVGDWGRDEGQFYYPAGITYAGAGQFIVADKFNDRIQVVRITVAGVTPTSRISIRGQIYLALLLLLLLIILVWAVLGRRRRLSRESSPAQIAEGL